MSPRDRELIAAAWARAARTCALLSHAQGVTHLRHVHFDVVRLGCFADLSPLASGYYLDALRAAWGA